METMFPVVPSHSQSEKPITSSHVRELFPVRVSSYLSLVSLRVLND